MGERVALNYIQRMSGIATETNKYQKAVGEYKAKIVDTRKTTPLFRAFEKYSVKTGGGKSHRFNLSDCAMIKDNHIKYAGSLTKAVEKLKKDLSHAHKIEVECDTKEQVKAAIECGADIIMLDNMDLNEMKECVQLINGRAIVEPSGIVILISPGAQCLAASNGQAERKYLARWSRVNGVVSRERYEQVDERSRLN